MSVFKDQATQLNHRIIPIGKTYFPQSFFFLFSLSMYFVSHLFSSVDLGWLQDSFNNHICTTQVCRRSN